MKKVLHMVETTEERHATRLNLLNKAVNTNVYVTFWEGFEYHHVYTWAYSEHWGELLLGMEIVNHNEPQFNQFFLWREVELGVTHKEI